MDGVKVSLMQMKSSTSLIKNLQIVENLLFSAVREGSLLAIFPECVLFWGDSSKEQESHSFDFWQELLSDLSRRFGIAIHWGGLALAEDGEVYNSALVFGADGNFVHRYDKRHLFQLFGADKSLDETQAYARGNSDLSVYRIGGWTFGSGICYDIRFPELYRQYAGCDVLICTAAFTKKTGEAHWELLLRARAVENQAYTLGVGQCGLNEVSGHAAYGHSMAIDPWGKVIQRAKDEPTCLTVTLERAGLNYYRDHLPALKNRRL